VLRTIKPKASHPADSIWYLHCHAVELFLAAYFSAQGASVEELRDKYGHKVTLLE
jgi:hypothetical protein